jgi:hypothetical protein
VFGGAYFGQAYPASIGTRPAGPVNVTAPVISGGLVEGQLLTCDPGTWKIA